MLYTNGEVLKKVHAAGSLRGQTEYEFSKEYLYHDSIKDYTGKIKNGIGIGINNKKIVAKYLPKGYKYDISIEEKVFNIFGLKLKLIFEEYAQYAELDLIRTKEELLKQGEYDSAVFLSELEAEGKKYVSHTVEIVENENGVIYNVCYIIEEDIGEFVEIGE